MLSCFSRVQLFVTLWTILARLLCPWDSPGKSTGVSCHFLLQRIFLTQGLYPHNLCLLHCRRILYHCATWEACTFLYRHLFKCTKTLSLNPPNYTFQTHKHVTCKCIHNIFQNTTLNCHETQIGNSHLQIFFSTKDSICMDLRAREYHWIISY